MRSTAACFLATFVLLQQSSFNAWVEAAGDSIRERESGHDAMYENVRPRLLDRPETGAVDWNQIALPRLHEKVRDSEDLTALVQEAMTAFEPATLRDRSRQHRRSPPISPLRTSPETPSAITPSVMTPSAITPSATTPSVMTPSAEIQSAEIQSAKIPSAKTRSTGISPAAAVGLAPGGLNLVLEPKSGPVEGSVGGGRKSRRRTMSGGKRRRAWSMGSDEGGRSVSEATENSNGFRLSRGAVMATLVGLLLLLAIGLQLTLRRVKKSLLARDRELLEVLETVMRTTSIIALASAAVKLISAVDFVEYGLDNLLFNKYYEPNHISNSRGGLPRGEANIMEKHGRIVNQLSSTVQALVDYFLLAYIVFAIAFALSAYAVFRWVRRAEELSIEESLAEGGRNGGNLAEYVVARYEYLDRVEGRLIKSLDPKHGWFAEYFRACLTRTTIKILDLPASTLALIFLLSFALVPLSLLDIEREFVVVGLTLSLAALVAAAVLYRLQKIKRRLLPADPAAYCAVRYQLEHAGLNEADAALCEQQLQANLPRFLIQPDPITDPLTDSNAIGKKERVKRGGQTQFKDGRFHRWMGKMLYGTQHPNKQEALFLFKRKGPSAVTRAVAWMYMTWMLSLAYLTYQIDDNELFQKYDGIPRRVWLALLVCVLLFLVLLAIAPVFVYLLTFVSSTNHMLREDVLTNVFVTNRSLFVQRLAQFIDSLKTAALLEEIQNAGPSFLTDLIETLHRQPQPKSTTRHQQARSLNSSGVTPPEFNDAGEEEESNAEQLWEALLLEAGTENYLPLENAHSFIVRQGLNLPSDFLTRQLLAFLHESRGGNSNSDQYTRSASALLDVALGEAERPLLAPLPGGPGETGREEGLGRLDSDAERFKISSVQTSSAQTAKSLLSSSPFSPTQKSEGLDSRPIVLGVVKNKKAGGDDVVSRMDFEIIYALLPDLLRRPLDPPTVERLMVESWRIELEPGTRQVSLESIDKILRQRLDIRWTKTQQRHFLSFLAATSNARTIDLSLFMSALVKAEATTVETLNQTTQKMISNDADDAAASARKEDRRKEERYPLGEKASV